MREVIDWSTLQQKDICKATGISTSTLSSYVKGKTPVSLENLFKIAAALDVSPWIFLNGEPLPVKGMDLTAAEEAHMREYRMLTGSQRKVTDDVIREFNHGKG